MTQWDRRPSKRYASSTDRVRAAERFRHHVWSPKNPRGRIMRPWWCPICRELAKTQPIQAHHVDYRKPFLVVWCCTSCHRGIEAGSVHLRPWHIFDYSSLVRVYKNRWRKGSRGPQMQSIIGRRRTGQRIAGVVPF